MALLAIQDMVIFGVLGVNVVLAAILLAIYSRNYKKIGSKFTLGLIVFAAAFLIQNLASIYFYNTLLTEYTLGMTTLQLLVSVLEFFGLTILLYVTWK